MLLIQVIKTDMLKANTNKNIMNIYLLPKRCQLIQRLK
jgi:hypothetical protein